jgi:hypothetical protein
MATGRFVTVFDVLESGFKDWQFSAFGLIFVAVGTVIFLFPRIVKWIGIPYLDTPSLRQKAFRYFFLIFPILWTAIFFVATYSAYQRHRTLAQDNRCSVVEGPVENFVPMPHAGHADESFTVRGVRFAYSDYGVSDGFNNTSSHGGPISKDSYVRICYDPGDHVILRLAIRDFAGPIKDYSKSTLFPKDLNGPKPKLRRPPEKLTWYGNFVIALYVLDFVAILALFRPYLRTFFTLRTKVLADCPISGSLEPGKKLKLRNSLVYWDKESHTISLRARGFNALQTPQMVAKLTTDADDGAIIREKFLFSSGFPFIMALFFWVAYEFFSATMPGSGMPLSAGEFVGIAVVMLVVVGLLRLRTIINRIDRLVEDALTELAGRSAPSA